MLYKPSHMMPYYTDIDVTTSNQFSCVINAIGSTTISKYLITIKDLSGTTKYTKEEIPSEPIYNDDILSIIVPSNSEPNNHMANGYDYVWNVKLYESTPSIYVTNGAVTNSGTSTTTHIFIKVQYLITVGHYIQIGTEMRKITRYNNETGEITVSSAFSEAPSVGTLYTILSDYIISDDTYFKARTTPTVVIDNVPSETVNRKDYTFTATYNQAQNVNYKYFQWILYDEGNNIVQESELIYQGTIQYKFDGLISGRTYKVKVLLVTQDDSVCEELSNTFDVLYDTYTVDVKAQGISINDKTCIEVEWSNLYTTKGVGINTETQSVITDDLVYRNNNPFSGVTSVNLDEQQSIIWTPQQFTKALDIPQENTVCVYFCPYEVRYEKDIYESGNDTFIGYDYNFTPQINSWSPTVDSIAVEVIRMETTVKIHIDYMGNSFPINFNEGEIFYNTSNNLLYTATETAWTDERIPLSTSMYEYNNVNYYYDGTSLIVSPYPMPYYSVRYATGGNVRKENYGQLNQTTNMDWFGHGTFYYEIYNMDEHYIGSVDVEIPNARPHTIDGMDIDTDMNVSPYWFKLTLLPTTIQVERISTSLPNIFRPVNSTLVGGVLLKDYKLLKTDVLYR